MTTITPTAFPPISIRELSMLIDVDRDAIRKAIASDSIQPCAKGPRGHHLYPAADLLKALFNRRGNVDASLLSPADRRNLAQARLAELEHEKRSGSVLPREAVRRATGEAYAMVAQSVRSIPDLCERKTGADPNTCQLIENVIDQVCSDLADRMEAVYRESRVTAGE
jgi:hypothetical protein